MFDLTLTSTNGPDVKYIFAEGNVSLTLSEKLHLKYITSGKLHKSSLVFHFEFHFILKEFIRNL